MKEAEIRSAFEQYGPVKEVKVITDRTGVSKGWVEYEKLLQVASYVDSIL